MKKRFLYLFLAALMLLLPACSQPPGGKSDPDSTTGGSAEQSTEAIDKLAGYNYNGKEFRVLTSINSSEGVITNSNYMIEGTEEINGESVNDAVYKRNNDVKDLLGINFKYTPMDADYDTVQAKISKAVLSGSDDYDLVINDIRTLANLSLQNMFLNFKQNPIFDLSQSYWYKDFMDDISIGNEKEFLLAGDYFIDILRNCHSMFLNKTMLEEVQAGRTEELYKLILDGKWTLEEFMKLIKPFLVDLDGNGTFDKKDQYGFFCVGTWGSAMPFMMAADTDVITKDADGWPVLTINNPKSTKLHELLTTLFLTDSGASSKFLGNELITEFQNRRSLICGYQRLSALQTLRDMKDEVVVLPYPKLDLLQEKYVTSSHDTIEIGAIPSTTPNFDMICVVLEALNRETKHSVIPIYYEQSLKIKYTRDELSAQMIDLIHDNQRNVFPVAYSEQLVGLLTLYDVTTNKNFSSAYEKLAPQVEKKLAEAIEAIQKTN